MKKIGLSLLLCFAFIQAIAQESQTGYNFLRLPVSAHAGALGGDNISLVDNDASLIFHNPALLSAVDDKNVSFSYMRYMHDANAAAAAFNRNITERASWAVSGQYLHYGTMKQTDEQGVITGSFTAKDIALTGYFSYLLTDYLAGGVAVKWIFSSLGSYHAVATGVDLGLNYYLPDNELSFSLVAKNLGGQLKAFNEDFERMPIDIQFGVSKHLVNTPFRVHATLVDLNHWNYKFIDHCKAGLDVLLSPSVWIGAGYNFRRAHEMTISSAGDTSVTNGAGLSFGAGLNLERFKLNLGYGKYHVSSSSLIFNVAFSL